MKQRYFKAVDMSNEVTSFIDTLSDPNITIMDKFNEERYKKDISNVLDLLSNALRIINNNSRINKHNSIFTKCEKYNTYDIDSEKRVLIPTINKDEETILKFFNMGKYCQIKFYQNLDKSNNIFRKGIQLDLINDPLYHGWDDAIFINIALHNIDGSFQVEAFNTYEIDKFIDVLNNFPYRMY